MSNNQNQGRINPTGDHGLHLFVERGCNGEVFSEKCLYLDIKTLIVLLTLIYLHPMPFPLKSSTNPENVFQAGRRDFGLKTPYVECQSEFALCALGEGIFFLGCFVEMFGEEIHSTDVLRTLLSV